MKLPHITAAGLIPIYLATSVLAGIKEIWWNITYVEGVNPDGLFERRVIGVNNTWPYVIPSPVSTCFCEMISHIHFSDHLQLKFCRRINWFFTSQTPLINQQPSIIMGCFLRKLHGWTGRDKYLSGKLPLTIYLSNYF